MVYVGSSCSGSGYFSPAQLDTGNCSASLFIRSTHFLLSRPILLVLLGLLKNTFLAGRLSSILILEVFRGSSSQLLHRELYVLKLGVIPYFPFSSMIQKSSDVFRFTISIEKSELVE